jgi:GNAT superfamily N-acetyltransferase
MIQHLTIRLCEESDISEIVHQFELNNWPKPRSTFEMYLNEQKSGKRLFWVAFVEQQFAGYVTLKWNSLYPSFKDQDIPEIMDLNVLPPWQGQGIGLALLGMAENTAFQKKTKVGLGVGLYPGYGKAQQLYVAKGYMPDGLGATYAYQRVTPGEQVVLDDDLVLWFIKQRP